MLWVTLGSSSPPPLLPWYPPGLLTTCSNKCYTFSFFANQNSKISIFWIDQLLFTGKMSPTQKTAPIGQSGVPEVDPYFDHLRATTKRTYYYIFCSKSLWRLSLLLENAAVIFLFPKISLTGSGQIAHLTICLQIVKIYAYRVQNFYYIVVNWLTTSENKLLIL